MIAADSGVLPIGRLSFSVSKYCRLKFGVDEDDYAQQLLQIMRLHDIDVWVSCSGVATAMSDALVVSKVAEQGLGCKLFQFDTTATSILDNKMSFMKQTSAFDLPCPAFYSIPPNFSMEIVQDVVTKMQEDHDRNPDDNPDDKPDYNPRRFIIKNEAMDDSTRGVLPIFAVHQEPESLFNTLFLLGPSQSWVLQELLNINEEYCTHAVVVEGKVKAFTACPSDSILLHYDYDALPPDDHRFIEMLSFTKTFAGKMQAKYGNFTGHLSFDFLARFGDGVRPLLPIECNPRCHTATVNFGGKERELVIAYLKRHKNHRIVSKHGSNQSPNETESEIVFPIDEYKGMGYYWITHDLVVLGLLPLINLLRYPSDQSFHELAYHWYCFLWHLCLWKDAAFEWWDPLPWFLLNHIVWPWNLLVMAWKGERWTQLNVSTMKVFKLKDVKKRIKELQEKSKAL